MEEVDVRLSSAVLAQTALGWFAANGERSAGVGRATRDKGTQFSVIGQRGVV